MLALPGWSLLMSLCECSVPLPLVAICELPPHVYIQVYTCNLDPHRRMPCPPHTVCFAIRRLLLLLLQPDRHVPPRKEEHHTGPFDHAPGVGA